MVRYSLLRITGGVVLALMLFPTTDSLTKAVGVQSPIFPVVVTPVIVAFAFKKSAITDGFPLIGVGFYLIMGWIIGWTDMTVGSYPAYYGWTLLLVASVAFAVWLLHMGLKRITSLLPQTLNRLFQPLLSLAPMAILLFLIHSIRQFRIAVLFGLTGVLGICIHFLLILASIDIPPLLAASFAMAALLAMIPFFGRLSVKEVRNARDATTLTFPKANISKERFKPAIPITHRAMFQSIIPNISITRYLGFTWSKDINQGLRNPNIIAGRAKMMLLSPITKARGIFKLLRRRLVN